MPTYILEKNYLHISQDALKNKIIDLSVALGLVPKAQYQTEGDDYILWEFDTYIGTKAFFQCRFHEEFLYWQYGNSWDPENQVIEGGSTEPLIRLPFNSIIDICIVKNPDIFGIFIEIDGGSHSLLLLLPQIFDASVWGGFDLFFCNSQSQNPNTFFTGGLSRFNPGQYFSLSFCGSYDFSVPNTAGNISVLSGLFLQAPNGGGILAGFSGNTGIAATGFLERFSEVSDANNQDKWLILFRGDGGLVIKV